MSLGVPRTRRQRGHTVYSSKRGIVLECPWESQGLRTRGQNGLSKGKGIAVGKPGQKCPIARTQN